MNSTNFPMIVPTYFSGGGGGGGGEELYTQMGFFQIDSPTLRSGVVVAFECCEIDRLLRVGWLQCHMIVIHRSPR